jgi:single-stranded DNA-binding protein
MEMIIGNLAQEPQIKEPYKGGTEYVLLRVATNRRLDRDKTDFHNVHCRGWHANRALKYLKKGSLVAIMGEYQIYSFRHSGGWTQLAHIDCMSMEILDSRVGIGVKAMMTDEDMFPPTDPNAMNVPIDRTLLETPDGETITLSMEPVE